MTHNQHEYEEDDGRADGFSREELLSQAEDLAASRANLAPVEQWKTCPAYLRNLPHPDDIAQAEASGGPDAITATMRALYVLAQSPTQYLVFDVRRLTSGRRMTYDDLRTVPKAKLGAMLRATSHSPFAQTAEPLRLGAVLMDGLRALLGRPPKPKKAAEDTEA
jgi:hypothetical protein